MRDCDNFEYGRFSDKTVKAYLHHMRNPDDTRSDLGAFYQLDHVNYFFPRSLIKEIAPDRSFSHTISPDTNSNKLQEHQIGSLLYMDIGRWGGSAKTRENTDAAWGRCRDFGLVCGRTAALCTYQWKNRGRMVGKKSVDDDSIQDKIRDDAGYQKMLTLLNTLSSTDQLGRVTVTKALTCMRTNQEIPDWDTIYVFLGDIHAPIATEKIHTYGGADLRDTYGDPIPRSQVDVPSWNRLDLTAIKQSAALLLLAAKISLPLTAAALKLFSEEIMNAIRDSQFIKHPPNDTESITMDEAEEWFDLYSGKKGKKGADIFEEADADLSRWIELLQKYQKEETPTNPKIRFVQTGDLFDFWIGLKVGFTDAFDDIAYKYAVQHSVRLWVNQACAYNPGVEKMFRYIDLGMDLDKGFEPVYLYGNHDNYLSAMRTIKSTMAATFETTGLRAEHGHYSDTFNHDQGPSLGWAITQLAYIFPSIRKLEDPAASYLSQGKGWVEENFDVDLDGTIGPRLTAMQYAIARSFVERLKNNQKPQLAFVQGHSHRPLLKEIRLIEGRW